VKTGRNEKCPCGSDKKFKRCCLNKSYAPVPGAEAKWAEAAPLPSLGNAREALALLQAATSLGR